MAARPLLGTARVHRNTMIETLKSCIDLGRELRPKADETVRLYDQCQGLMEKVTGGLVLSETDGIPLAGTSRWSELSDQERLSENFRAYKVFSSYLRLCLRNMPDCARYPRLSESLMELCTQTESFLVLISQLMMAMGMPVPSVRVPPVNAPKDWDRKVWGHQVLRELSNWSLRSVRDFNKLKTNLSSSWARRRQLRGAQLR
ncbi:ciliary neurotrophic factor-like [Stegostoma tigrinum]|uniref:ciliary neurotrophic factor-like n=1 Tax=Stegostoma tigrinum TaxID=3053191 RepID=UPI00286FBC33|nr:ciliary neurotrophic factor-like [Stegostoma tigrinum]